jgi:hypothetical protein
MKLPKVYYTFIDESRPLRKRSRKKNACQISLESGGQVSPESLLRIFWGKNNQKWSCATRVTTVPSVMAVLTDGMARLKNFETFGGSIDKIETLVIKLKIVANFRGVNSNFPKDKVLRL